MHKENEMFDQEITTIKAKKPPRNPRVEKFDNWAEEFSREFSK